MNITLRLWSGYLSAKTIALEIRSGPNTPEMHSLVFSTKTDSIVQKDPIYRAGVEAAPSFKRLRREDYSFDGVPKTPLSGHINDERSRKHFQILSKKTA